MLVWIINKLMGVAVGELPEAKKEKALKYAGKALEIVIESGARGATEGLKSK